jgi:hypothetical protein
LGKGVTSLDIGTLGAETITLGKDATKTAINERLFGIDTSSSHLSHPSTIALIQEILTA